MSCIQKPRHLSIFPQEVFERGIRNICLKKEPPVGKCIAGIQEGVSSVQWGFAISIGENSQTLFRHTHKQGLLKCDVSLPAVWLTFVLVPLRSVPQWGLTVYVKCKWHMIPEMSTSHCWHNATSEERGSGVCMGTPQKRKSVWKDDHHEYVVKPLGYLSSIHLGWKACIHGATDKRLVWHQKSTLKTSPYVVARVSCSHSNFPPLPSFSYVDTNTTPVPKNWLLKFRIWYTLLY